MMPIEAVIKNHKEYYRWGKTGKLYSTIKKAKRQGRILNREKKDGS